MSITDKLSLCAGGYPLPRGNKPCAKCGATQSEPCGRMSVQHENTRAELAKEQQRADFELRRANEALGHLQVLSAKAKDAYAAKEDLCKALRLILPMAKGYAHEHPVGSNQEKVNEAAEILGRVGDVVFV